MISTWFAIFENESSALGFQIGLSWSIDDYENLMRLNLEFPSLLSRNPLSEDLFPPYRLLTFHAPTWI